MARSKGYDDTPTVLIPVALENQLLPGTLEFASQELGERGLETSIFGGRYKNEERGCPADVPQLVRKGILFVYSRGIIAWRQSEQAGRANLTVMALAGGRVPEHRTIAPCGSSRKEEMSALLRAILLVWAEQDLLGGTPFARDGVTRPSNAAKEGSGRGADWRRKQEKLAEKLKQGLVQHEAADKAGEAVPGTEPL